jgi:hypothetical protein
MALTYTWAIKTLRKQNDQANNLSDVIVHVQWECTGTDENGHTGTFNGAAPLELNPADIGAFLPYASLTEADVITWIQDIVNGNPGYKAHIDEQIQKQIDDKVNPAAEVTSEALPWAPPANTSSNTVTSNTVSNTVTANT